jgi:nucleoside-diphosphate-sugar epimerase
MQRVLITGSAGRLGRATVRELTARSHAVTGFDRVPTPGLPADRAVVGTLDDLDTLVRLAKGQDCLVHLAATPDDAEYPRQTDFDNFESELVPNNIVGTYRVMEAARRAGVPRIVLASSGQTIDGHLRAATSGPAASRYRRPCRPSPATFTPAQKSSSNRSDTCTPGTTASMCSSPDSAGARET